MVTCGLIELFSRGIKCDKDKTKRGIYIFFKEIILYLVKPKDFVTFDEIRLSVEFPGELVQGSKDPHYTDDLFNE